MFSSLAGTKWLSFVSESFAQNSEYVYFVQCEKYIFLCCIEDCTYIYFSFAPFESAFLFRLIWLTYSYSYKVQLSLSHSYTHTHANIRSIEHLVAIIRFCIKWIDCAFWGGSEQVRIVQLHWAIKLYTIFFCMFKFWTCNNSPIQMTWTSSPTKGVSYASASAKLFDTWWLSLKFVIFINGPNSIFQIMSTKLSK